jgi:error-prone DNA polymerase
MEVNVDRGEILAHWREAGEWWNYEPYREFTQYIDSKGVRREDETLMPSIGSLVAEGQQEYKEDNTIEVADRAKKIRDEKVSAACGNLPTSYYADRIREREHRDGGKGYAFGAKVRMPHRESRRDDWGMPTGYSGIKAVKVSPTSTQPYVPLHVHSGYAFGRGTMLAEEVPLVAASLGLAACAITDPISLVGAYEFKKACVKHGLKPLIGATFEMPESGELVLIAKNKSGYECLSRLITVCHLEEPRQYPLCSWERLERFHDDLICLTGGDTGPLNRLLIRRDLATADDLLRRLIGLFGRRNVFIEIEISYLPWQGITNSLLLELASRHGLTPVIGGVVTHARPEDFPVQDILTCVDTLCTVDEVIGRKSPRDPSQPQASRPPERALNAERFMRRPDEMALLPGCNKELLANTLLVAEQCESNVLPGRTELPQVFENDNHALREITYLGAVRRHGAISSVLRKRLDMELSRIVELDFARHFLTAYDMVQWADEHRIQYSGRGSVVDSAVAYCLGFTRIDALKHNLHFERFLPRDGTKRPDIDIDFEAKHRDDIREYLTRKYGREHVATVAAVGAYCTRGIVREVGKALGLSNETIGFLAKRIHGGVPAHQLESALEQRPELRDSGIPKERFRWVFRLSEKLMDVPRNMRAHSSGVVISSRPIEETVPVMWSASVPRTEFLEDYEQSNLRIIQWDKRSAKHCFDKFDLLCLRGQDVLAGTEDRVRINTADFDVTQVSTDDPEVYRAMRAGELIGVPQSASPAMRQAHIRIRTENLSDASLVQAGIRPGVGGAVKINQLIARRRGIEQYTIENEELNRILGRTYGVIVFQEQVDQLLETFCGFSSGEAEDMRDSIYKRRREDFAEQVRLELSKRMIERGFGSKIAEQVVEYVTGFKGYGFAEGHALAFAEVSIRSIWCQQNFPAEYFAALLDAQPAGYYGPCTIANEARVRGVKVLPPNINRSDLKFSVENVMAEDDPKIVVPSGGIRVPFTQIKNLSKATREGIVEERQKRPYESFFDLSARVRPARNELEALILCGAFDELHANRRMLLWAVPNAIQFASTLAAHPSSLPLWIPEPKMPEGIEDFSAAEKAVYERQILELDVEQHLMSFERERIKAKGTVSAADAGRLPNKTKAIVVGNPIRLRFPPTASGKRVMFFDLEDETGLLNVTCFNETYLRDGHAVITSPYVTLRGEAQERDGHIAFLATRVFPYQPRLGDAISSDSSLPITTADFLFS